MKEISILSIVARMGVLLCVATANVEAQPTQNLATISIDTETPARTYDRMIFRRDLEAKK